MSQKPETPSARAGNLTFVALLLLFAAFLLSQIGAETKFSAKGKLFAQPRFWPAIGVGVMVVCGLGHLILSWRDRLGWGIADVVFWARAVEYLAWFMVYVWAVPIVGYLAATLAFTVLLALRQGYRSAKEISAAALLGLAIVLVFKTGLSVKILGGAIYEYLPDGLRNFMIVNF